MIDVEGELINDMAKFTHKPYEHAVYCYPWGKGELEKSKGPRTWQKQVLQRIGEELRKKKNSKSRVVRISVASGSDIGKTALTAMIQKWALDTMEGCRGQVTANTGSQLRTKTWAELAKWHRLSETAHWFEINTASIVSTQENQRLEWRSDIAVWRENRTEAFAGFHNYGKRILLIFDEASGIPLPIWETAYTFCLDEDTEIIWIAFGNPTQSSGGFYDTFHKNKDQWIQFRVDSRTVEGTNKEEIDTNIKAQGEDSDWVRVFVKGEFPKASSTQFFPSDLVGAARKKIGHYTQYHPLILGIDLARGGDDEAVFYFRRGFDGKSIAFKTVSGELIHDSTHLVDLGLEIFREFRPDHIFGDETGLGGPILDVWKNLGWNIHLIGFGSKAGDVKRYENKTAEMADKAKKWLKAGGAICDDAQLEEDLCQRNFYILPDGRLGFETKKLMKKRGLLSPNRGDAFFLTFAKDVEMLAVDPGPEQETGDGLYTAGKYNPLARGGQTIYTPRRPRGTRR